MFGNEIEKAINKLGDKIAAATIEGLERGATIIGDKIVAKLGEINDSKDEARRTSRSTRSSNRR